MEIIEELEQIAETPADGSEIGTDLKAEPDKIAPKIAKKRNRMHLMLMRENLLFL